MGKVEAIGGRAYMMFCLIKDGKLWRQMIME